MKKKKKTNKKSNEPMFYSTELKSKKYYNDDYKKVVSFLIALIIILILVGGLFYLNGKFVTKDEFQTDETTETTTTTEVSIDNKLILVDNMFDMSDKEYMVMLYDTTDDSQSILYDSLVRGYQGKMTLYKVDLGSNMNKKYYDKDKKENKEPTSKDDLVVTKPTLVIFKNKKVTSYITNKDEIVKKLNK